jgi:TetR/AcrR family transcriptional repressor of mexJK operon
METLATPPADTVDEKHQKILKAAKELFLEGGYAATSMDQVATVARVSKTTLYTRFPSKEALFAATIEWECQAFGMRFSPTDFAGLPVDEALCQIGQRFVNLLGSPEAVRVDQLVNGEAARFPEIAMALYRAGPEHICRLVARYLDHATAQGMIDVADTEFAAEQFLFGLKGCSLHPLAMHARPPLTPQEQTDYIAKAVALFLDGARGRR